MLKITREDDKHWIEEDSFIVHGPYDSIAEVGTAVAQILADSEARAEKLRGQTFYVDTTNIYMDRIPNEL